MEMTFANADLFFQVVHGLLLVMDDDENPRVQGHGAAAIVNFSEECPKALLAKYLDVIMDKLELVLTKKFKEVITDKLLTYIYKS